MHACLAQLHWCCWLSGWVRIGGLSIKEKCCYDDINWLIRVLADMLLWFWLAHLAHQKLHCACMMSCTIDVLKQHFSDCGMGPSWLVLQRLQWKHWWCEDQRTNCLWNLPLTLGCCGCHFGMLLELGGDGKDKIGLLLVALHHVCIQLLLSGQIQLHAGFCLFCGILGGSSLFCKMLHLFFKKCLREIFPSCIPYLPKNVFDMSPHW